MENIIYIIIGTIFSWIVYKIIRCTMDDIKDNKKIGE